MRLLDGIPWFVVLVGSVFAEELGLDQTEAGRQVCQGMYSRRAWGGSVEPYIQVKFRRYTPPNENDPIQDPWIAAAVYEYQDEKLIGIKISDTADQKTYICDDEAIASSLCTEDNRGAFLKVEDADDLSRNVIKTRGIELNTEDIGIIQYDILNTGYYCVLTARASPGDFDYAAVAEFRNAYGELPGAQIAKLPFYGGLTIVYAVIGIYWAFLYVQNRHDILPVQNYITATIVFLVVEMLMTWGYYDYMNRHGSNFGSKVLLIIVAILNAGRNSLSFFLLLIVCMGYGVVKPSLGKTMVLVRWLAITHFVFGVLYALASLTIAAEDAGPLILLVILPLAATLTTFYVWTLNSLGATMKDLAARKQRVKANMYKKLWWAILASVLTIFAFFFINAFIFAGTSSPEFTPSHWQTRWFVLDGWMNLVYLADLSFVAYLWRPTANNRRFAMSDELSQDDEGFEIASVRESLDEEELGDGRPPGYAPAGSEPPSAMDGPLGSLKQPNRTASPLPAPQPKHPPANVKAPRESLDGETIFAVGEDGDRFSDSDGEEEEKTKLNVKSN